MSGLAKKLHFFSYRTRTILKSFKILYTLPQDKIDAFLDSYNIFDHDWANEDELSQKMGADYYTQVKKKLIDYYSVLNHMCAIGQVEKMYIPPLMDPSKGIIANQFLFEKKMAEDLGINKESRVLDIGCGRGRIASHVASLTGAHVSGMNIDTNQIECARQFALDNNLNTQFKIADLNEVPLPFGDRSMDAVYEVQAFSYSKNLEQLFKDIHRILKPGGRVSCLDWFRLDKYNPNDSVHVDLMRRVKPLIGAIGTPSIEEYVNSLKKAGFKILINRNASIDGLQAPLIENAHRMFSTLSSLIRSLVFCKILPNHFQSLFSRLTKDGEAFTEADRKGLVTTSHYIIAEKL